MSEWRKTKLGDVITLKRGYDLPNSSRIFGAVPVVSSSGVSDYHNEYKVKAPGVITGRYGTIGEVFYVTKDFWPLNTTLYVEDFKGSEPLFISYFLRCIDFQAFSAKSAVPGINRNDLHLADISIPHTAIQRKISYILSTYDNLIENNNRRIAILEEMAQKLYREWFVHFRFPGHENIKMVESEMGTIPEGWKVVDVKEVVFRCKNGTVYKDSDIAGAGTVPVIDQSTNDVLGYHNNYPDFKATVESPIAIFGDHTCKMQLNVRPFSIGSNVVAFVSSKNHSMTFVFYSVKNLIETREYKRHWNDFMKKSIIIPRENQEKAFSNVLAPFLEQIEILKQKNTNLRKTRDLLLPHLISGDIDVSGLDIPTKEG